MNETELGTVRNVCVDFKVEEQIVVTKGAIWKTDIKEFIINSLVDERSHQQIEITSSTNYY